MRKDGPYFAATKPSVSSLTRWGACQVSPQIPQRFSCVSWMQPSHHVPNTIFTCSAKYHRRRSPVRERNTSAIKARSTKTCAVGISEHQVSHFNSYKNIILWNWMSSWLHTVEAVRLILTWSEWVSLSVSYQQSDLCWIEQLFTCTTLSKIRCANQQKVPVWWRSGLLGRCDYGSLLFYECSWPSRLLFTLLTGKSRTKSQIVEICDVLSQECSRTVWRQK